MFFKLLYLTMVMDDKYTYTSITINDKLPNLEDCITLVKTECIDPVMRAILIAQTGSPYWYCQDSQSKD